MKCQTPFSGKQKEKYVNVSSVENFTQSSHMLNFKFDALRVNMFGRYSSSYQFSILVKPRQSKRYLF